MNYIIVKIPFQGNRSQIKRWLELSTQTEWEDTTFLFLEVPKTYSFWLKNYTYHVCWPLKYKDLAMQFKLIFG